MILRVLLMLSSGLAVGLPMTAMAQVAVGYRNPVVATAFGGLEERRGQRETVQFGVAGVNVIPSDGSLIYDENTIWRIDQPSRPFSLTVTENNPLLDLRNSDISTRSAQVRRSERLFVQVSGPAADSLQSVFPVESSRVLDPTLPSIILSVFTP